MTANVNAVNPHTTPKPGLLPEKVGLVDAVAVAVEVEMGKDPDTVDVGLGTGLDAVDEGLGGGVSKEDGIGIEVGCGRTITV